MMGTWIVLAWTVGLPLAFAQREILSLDGEWQIEDSRDPAAPPTQWRHKVPVPGLANLATPPFPHVDEYLTFDNLKSLMDWGLLPKDGPPKPGAHQDRNWFWYRKTFRVPAARQVAVLRVNKAQFSTAVWLNGKKIGEHLGCYTAGIFDLTEAIAWHGENTLIVRVGAHPGVMPEDVPSGTDFEKAKWTPGIYDSVSVLLSDNPVLVDIQVAPRISPAEILVQSRIRNYANAPVTAPLMHSVRTWLRPREVARLAPMQVTLAPGEVKIVTASIAMPNGRLWSPEDPFLYVLDTSTGGDSLSTRFGLREFRFDTPTRRAYLNGKVYFLRGSNITLHRFFEDPAAGALPWNEEWVRKLLVDIPKSMDWNTFRFCIGPPPERWFELADEHGLLIQNEYFIWTGAKDWKLLKRYKWNAAELIRQYADWMRDHWNHPSVVIWDANNETDDDIFAEQVIPAVRGLDLSNRPWENSYGLPAGPDDPVEHHPYLFQQPSNKQFDMPELETMTGGIHRPVKPPGHGHASILNEYGWLWVLRDGAPCVVTKKIYDTLLGPDANRRTALN